jgi:DNA replication licensing factor MCM2
MDNMEADYVAKPEMDAYDGAQIDDDDQQELDFNARAEADRRLNQEDRLRAMAAGGQGRRMPGAFAEDVDIDDDHEEMQARLRQDRFRMMREEARGEMDDIDMNENDAAVDYDDSKGPIQNWLRQPSVIKWIIKQFSNFLKEQAEDKIHRMCQENKQSLVITYNDFSRLYPQLAIWLAEEPALILPVFDQVAMEVLEELYPDYKSIHEQVFVRVKDLPVEDKLRALRQNDLNSLIKIGGVVTKRTTVFPELVKSHHRCVKCNYLMGPTYHHQGEDMAQILGCCNSCQSRGPFHLEENMSVYRNYQKWTVQETPGSVPPGRVPRQKEVYILNDLVDSARPGDEVEITGIFKNKFEYGANVKHGFPVFATLIEANYVKRFGDEQVIELTDEDKKAIRDLSKQPNVAARLFDSVAPSIYGHDFIKRGLALAMFGGVPKDIGGKHRTRGDINMLLLGDPGTAKSQFLKYVEQVFPRVVYTTGKGASAVGLTAGVHKDPVSGEWTLEAGALVLADKGVCLIDEFDKMNDQDRTSIHEAMEQQSISISKAGIVTSLQARCSVIAAANPLKGTYTPSLSFTDNVDLTDPILSRFDLLSVIRDEVDEEHDDALATFVINSHIKSQPNILKMRKKVEGDMTLTDEQKLEQLQVTDSYLQETLLDCTISSKLRKAEELIPQALLKKYLIYAKRFCHPKLNEIDKDKLMNFYADIRRESSVAGGIPIAVRHIESVIRMSEAFAKVHLRQYVRIDDIDAAIEMLLDSFLQTQKASVRKQLERKFEKYRAKRNDTSQLLLYLLRSAIKDRVSTLIIF